MPGKRKTRQHPEDLQFSLLKKMILIRRFEEKASQMYGLRKIGGFCHLYIGQEAVAVGAVGTLDLAKDYVVTAYRDHGHALSCGLSPNELMAELYGKKDGCSGGKGGSMHFYSAEKHMLGGNGIVGSQIPVATGVGLKLKTKNEQGLVLCFFGDGAIHQGAFHESLNLAKIWNLPVVYICENNQYGMGTDFRRVSAIEDFSKMGASYGIEGKNVDGMDVLEVYDSVAEAARNAREEGQPGFLNIRTYRYKGHSMSDPAKYRTKDEVSAYRKQDPIELLKAKMVKSSILNEDQYKEFDEEAKKACDEAVDFAEKSEPPPLEALYENVFTD